MCVTRSPRFPKHLGSRVRQDGPGLGVAVHRWDAHHNLGWSRGDPQETRPKAPSHQVQNQQTWKHVCVWEKSTLAPGHSQYTGKTACRDGKDLGVRCGGKHHHNILDLLISRICPPSHKTPHLMPIIAIPLRQTWKPKPGPELLEFAIGRVNNKGIINPLPWKTNRF
jgi:hypothetical protein